MGGLVSCMREARFLRSSASVEAVKLAKPPPRVPSVAAVARIPGEEYSSSLTWRFKQQLYGQPPRPASPSTRDDVAVRRSITR
jgi:hypothetical protein